MRRMRRLNIFRKVACFFTLISFFVLSVIPSQALAQGVLGLPQPGAMVQLSPSFYPVLLKGVQVYPDNPLRFDFIMDTGDTGLEGDAFKEEASKVIKYFLAALTVPEDEFWVNLSPYEKDRIIADMLGQTEMGRDLLAQDYVLKQLSATLVNPDSDLGKKFWDRVYKKSYELYGTTQVPANTFNKIWIVPDEALVYEQGTYAFVGERHLKVMLEEDYVAMANQKAIAESRAPARDLGLDKIETAKIEKMSEISSKVVRDILIPEIEKEVNEGKLFSNLRQIFDSMILATWYKKTLKESLLGQIYVDQNKVQGIDVEDKTIKEQIYNQYLESFKKGVFDFVKVEKDIASNKNIPRKYFSGGVSSGIVKVKELKVRPLRTLGRRKIGEFLLSKSKKGWIRRLATNLVGADSYGADRLKLVENISPNQASQINNLYLQELKKIFTGKMYSSEILNAMQVKLSNSIHNVAMNLKMDDSDPDVLAQKIPDGFKVTYKGEHLVEPGIEDIALTNPWGVAKKKNFTYTLEAKVNKNGLITEINCLGDRAYGALDVKMTLVGDKIKSETKPRDIAKQFAARTVEETNLVSAFVDLNKVKGAVDQAFKGVNSRKLERKTFGGNDQLSEENINKLIEEHINKEKDAFADRVVNNVDKRLSLSLSEGQETILWNEVADAVSFAKSVSSLTSPEKEIISVYRVEPRLNQEKVEQALLKAIIVSSERTAGSAIRLAEIKEIGLDKFAIPEGWNMLKHGTDILNWGDNVWDIFNAEELIVKEQVDDRKIKHGLSFAKVDPNENVQDKQSTFNFVDRYAAPRDRAMLGKGEKIYIKVVMPKPELLQGEINEILSEFPEAQKNEVISFLSRVYFENPYRGLHPDIPSGSKLVKLNQETENGVRVFSYVPEILYELYKKAVVSPKLVDSKQREIKIYLSENEVESLMKKIIGAYVVKKRQGGFLSSQERLNLVLEDPSVTKENALSLVDLLEGRTKVSGKKFSDMLDQEDFDKWTYLDRLEVVSSLTRMEINLASDILLTPPWWNREEEIAYRGYEIDKIASSQGQSASAIKVVTKALADGVLLHFVSQLKGANPNPSDEDIQAMIESTKIEDLVAKQIQQVQGARGTEQQLLFQKSPEIIARNIFGHFNNLEGGLKGVIRRSLKGNAQVVAGQLLTVDSLYYGYFNEYRSNQVIEAVVDLVKAVLQTGGSAGKLDQGALSDLYLYLLNVRSAKVSVNNLSNLEDWVKEVRSNLGLYKSFISEGMFEKTDNVLGKILNALREDDLVGASDFAESVADELGETGKSQAGSAITLEEAKNKLEGILEEYPSLAVQDWDVGKIFKEREGSFKTKESLAIFILEITNKINKELSSILTKDRQTEEQKKTHLLFAVHLLNTLQDDLIGKQTSGRQWQEVALNGGATMSWTDLAWTLKLVRSIKGWDERHKNDSERKDVKGVFENLWNNVKQDEALAPENLKHLKSSFVVNRDGKVKPHIKDIINASFSPDHMSMIDLVDLSKMGATFLVDQINAVKNDDNFKSKITSIIIEHEEWGPLDVSIENLEGLGNLDIFKTGIKRIFFNLRDNASKQNLGALVFELRSETNIYFGVRFSPGPDISNQIGLDYVEKAYEAMGRGPAKSASAIVDSFNGDKELVLNILKKDAIPTGKIIPFIDGEEIKKVEAFTMSGKTQSEQKYEYKDFGTYIHRLITKLSKKRAELVVSSNRVLPEQTMHNALVIRELKSALASIKDGRYDNERNERIDTKILGLPVSPDSFETFKEQFEDIVEELLNSGKVSDLLELELEIFSNLSSIGSEEVLIATISDLIYTLSELLGVRGREESVFGPITNEEADKIPQVIDYLNDLVQEVEQEIDSAGETQEAEYTELVEGEGYDEGQAFEMTMFESGQAVAGSAIITRKELQTMISSVRSITGAKAINITFIRDSRVITATDSYLQKLKADQDVFKSIDSIEVTMDGTIFNITYDQGDSSFKIAEKDSGKSFFTSSERMGMQGAQHEKALREIFPYSLDAARSILLQSFEIVKEEHQKLYGDVGEWTITVEETNTVAALKKKIAWLEDLIDDVILKSGRTIFSSGPFMNIKKLKEAKMFLEFFKGFKISESIASSQITAAQEHLNAVGVNVKHYQPLKTAFEKATDLYEKQREFDVAYAEYSDAVDEFDHWLWVNDVSGKGPVSAKNIIRNAGTSEQIENLRASPPGSKELLEKAFIAANKLKPAQATFDEAYKQYADVVKEENKQKKPSEKVSVLKLKDVFQIANKESIEASRIINRVQDVLSQVNYQSKFDLQTYYFPIGLGNRIMNSVNSSLAMPLFRGTTTRTLVLQSKIEDQEDLVVYEKDGMLTMRPGKIETISHSDAWETQPDTYKINFTGKLFYQEKTENVDMNQVQKVIEDFVRDKADGAKGAAGSAVSLDQAKEKLKSQMFFNERINGAMNGTPLDDEAILKKIEPVLAQVVDYPGLTDLLRKTINTLDNIKADNDGKLKDLAEKSGWEYVTGDVGVSLKALNDLSKGVAATEKEVVRNRQVVLAAFKQSPDILPSAIGPGSRSVAIDSDGFAEFSFDQSFIGGEKNMTKYDVATIAAELLTELSELSTRKSDEVIDGTRVKRSFFQGENNEINISNFSPTQQRYFREIVSLRAEGRPIQPVGGIDLGQASSVLQIKRDGTGMPLPLSQQPMEFQNIQGFTPFIINVTPFNAQGILGQIEAEESEVQLSAA